ncbi:MAG: tetratricopeptide repeat protein [Saprospiraceae bacterium]|nr:tetratricopeptide repeat protein [Saprospiraceae bacterium]
MKQLKKVGFILMTCLVVSACTTQKKKGELSALGKLYHNTTAKYNGYFNARELMQETFVSLDNQHQDNYNKILPVFAYTEADNPQAVAGDLDLAMEKVSVVINLHRQSVWTDDCYLIIGQAQFLKKDYESAEETLRYLINEYSPRKMKEAKEKSQSKKKKRKSKSKKSKSSVKIEKTGNSKRDRKRYNREVKRNKKKKEREAKKNRKKGKKNSRKKKKSDTPRKPKEDTKETSIADAKKEKVEEKTEDEEVPAPIPTSISISDSDGEVEGDPESYFLKHRPAYQEGVLWLAKTLVARDNYDAAMRFISQLDRSPQTFKDIKSELAALQAHYYIVRKDYGQAIPQLDVAIEEASKRSLKARYAFIKAQIHQNLGQADEAYAAFEQSLKFRPTYEMEFSARLNMAQNAWLSGRGTAEEAKKNLNKMLKDPKNLAFKDQLYYALGQIALKEGNREEAISFLTQSLKSSRQNQSQRAESYLTLAGLFFEEENFVKAKSYYDSTMQVMPPTDERFGDVQAFSNNLTQIALHLQTIEVQDSLLAIAQLSDKEKQELALSIKKEQDEIKRQQALAKANQAAKKPQIGRSSAARGLKSSSFFAYNEKALRRGQREFSRVWGDRSLDDDWRRSARNSSGGFEEEIATDEALDSPSLEDADLDKLLQGVPKSKNEIETAHLKIREAMYNLGSLYRERLERNDKSVEILEELNERYPSSNYELDSWYILHIAYKDLNNPPKAKEYFDKIVNKYPTTNYAKILQDPNFTKNYLDEERRLNLQYDQIYGLFSEGKYQDAYSRSQQAFIKLLGKHNLKPKYALLMAMCVGNTKGKDAYISDLKKVISTYPNTDEQKRAKEILRFLGGATAQLPGQGGGANSGGFKYNEKDLHYIIVVFNESVKLNDNKIVIADYNQKYHKLDRIRITNIYLGPKNETPVLVMRRFKSKDVAMRYFEGVQKNMGDFLDPNQVDYDILPISQGNYRQVLRAKTLKGYKEFFELNY